MAKILPNLPIDKLTKENDYIGILTKGDIIKNFFLTHKHDFNRVKFFALYGEWGSGKSTLMKYLEKELKDSFNTFFFEAWEYESDHNLPKSLLEFLHYKSDTKVDTFFKNGAKLLEGFARSITFKTPVFNINSDKIIQSVEENSFFELKQLFKEEFEAWERRNVKEENGDKKPEYNIVFIDDLDRCEPENVLNLLSAIKLFFTYGKKTIFLCGIDKKAVDEAVKTKYKDVVKANEYLEKVFDLSFSMPKENDISKLVKVYFNEEEYSDVNCKSIDLSNEIAVFLKALKFENPRRVKKILNKYSLIDSLKKQDNKTSDLPNIITENSGTLFETLLTLYLLILKEFESQIFDSFLDLIFKKQSIKIALENYFNKSSNSNEFFREYSKITGVIINAVDKDIINQKIPTFGFRDFATIFLPFNLNSITPNSLDNLDLFNTGVSIREKKIDFYFCDFFINDSRISNIINNDQNNFNHSLMDYKRMIEDLS
ncbi:KAP family P-loop NTPase fold protein [Tenacibaculum jejuense]|uniref:Putative P-loop ATPase n=1 Tax=Tenacibaculum jejuense TaxID=584609 RepID=A0A238U7G0_9FLAO|nr:P-loop NTPase fold protein [Tenacibaculum jejuense]SNR14538.1 putative P-loop ATPase [Tenacibaculum jejuense]